MVERVLVLHRFFRLSANTQRDLLCHAENLSNSLFAQKITGGKRKARQQEPGRVSTNAKNLPQIMLITLIYTDQNGFNRPI
jgi:hypothetical protein